MSSYAAPRTVVIAGLGSHYRHDDAVGPVVAALAAESLGARVGGPYTDPLDLLGCWDHADLAVVVDATRSGTDPGTVVVIELEANDTPDSAHSPGAASTHGIGLAGVLRLARAVGRAPGRVVVVGVEGVLFTNGEGLSAPVAAAVPGVVRRVEQLVTGLTSCA